MINDKNQIIRSMKSYEEGGSSTGCLPGDGGCKASKAAKKNRRRKNWNTFKEGAGKVAGTVLGLGAIGTGAYGAKKLLDKQRIGGSVKKKK
jgi:hypothetical protein